MGRGKKRGRGGGDRGGGDGGGRGGGDRGNRGGGDRGGRGGGGFNRGDRGGGDHGGGGNNRGFDRGSHHSTRGGRVEKHGQQQGNTQKYCKNCKTTTHNTADCRNTQNNSNNQKNQNNQNNQANSNRHNQAQPQGSIYCKICKKKGNHTTADCKTSKPQKNLQRPCSTCLGWHKDAECTAQSGRLPDGSPIVCRNCQGPHYASQCPQQHGKNRGGGGEVLTMSGYVLRPCMFCNQNHLPTACPQARTLGPAGLDVQPPNVSVYPRGGNGYIKKKSRWEDDSPVEKRAFDAEQVHYNHLHEGHAAYHTRSYTQRQLSLGNEQFAWAGGLGREYHRKMSREGDGDVKMSDLEECEDCDDEGMCAQHWRGR
ncbi:hypothetical protein GLAREA_11496 [Glarea lozoyensis ATCC 20868]|uniref:CCHC-type domain-containing protein n=1 Tax=Glarea lozoyensis (strain ATCC 20868 / MF5171) TaxID=1116229 RepID=S3CG90_GLAL2|nr:uncharacterized protein GLAREA_11496 [Glarea lozoyensis ATCC 20868]EPE24915.1 hypothetical protein GLAREA_11496 [Glarea lozoyensis ATCC 20868]